MSRKFGPSAPEAPSLIWSALREEAAKASRAEATMCSLLAATILNHGAMSSALSYLLALKLGDHALPAMSLRDVIKSVYAADPSIVEIAEEDLKAALERDPACGGYLKPFLFYKGYQALQTHRVAHWLHRKGRETLADYLHSRACELFHVDINPAAKVGRGVFIDHGTGIVIGETAVVSDDVSILQGVTLGGTGAEGGDRHPKIGKGVLLTAGAKVLGPITIGDYAKIAAGSVVLLDVPAGCTAVGVPARLVNCPRSESTAETMAQTLPGDFA